MPTCNRDRSLRRNPLIRCAISLCAFLALSASLLLPAASFAQEAPSLNPTTLEFALQTGDSLTLFTTLNTPVDLTNLVVENNGLVNTAKTANIPPAKVILAPASGDIPAGIQSLAVTIQQPKQPGHYTGQLVLRFGEAPAIQPVTIILDVTVSAAPNVTASAASPNQTLQLRPSFFFVGRCPAGANQCAIPGNQIVITLEQTGLGEAQLSNVSADPLRSADNSRPGSVLSINPSITISQTQSTLARTLDLTVQADSWDIPPGKYTSGLRALVVDQDTPVTVPFTVNSKVGLFWPILIAVFGIGVGTFSAYLNRKVNPLSKAVDTIKSIQAVLVKHAWLQSEDVQTLAAGLQEIREKMVGGEDPTKIDASIAALQAQITAKEDAAKKFVADELPVPMQSISEMEFGQSIAMSHKPELDEIHRRVEKGEYNSLEMARNDLKAIQDQFAAISNVTKTFKEIETTWIGAESAKVSALKRSLMTAGSMDELDQLIGNALVEMPVPGIDYSAPSPVERIVEAFSPAAFEEFTASLKIQRWFGVGLSAFFALIGGLIALYYPNATWGASTSDYITLAVWALSVNVIAGQSFDFKAQLKPQITP